jgi:hypothetical protein
MKAIASSVSQNNLSFILLCKFSAVSVVGSSFHWHNSIVALAATRRRDGRQCNVVAVRRVTASSSTTDCEAYEHTDDTDRQQRANDDASNRTAVEHSNR